VRWYLRYALSYRDLEEMIQGRGLSLDHTAIYRWVQANVDQNRSYPPAVEELKEEGILSVAAQLRRRKFLNNIAEQWRRFIKRRINPGLGFFSFNTARRTIGGDEVMNMIRKGQVEGIGKGNIRGQVRFVESLFKVAA
jgi:transposase, IS6 family